MKNFSKTLLILFITFQCASWSYGQIGTLTTTRMMGMEVRNEKKDTVPQATFGGTYMQPAVWEHSIDPGFYQKSGLMKKIEALEDRVRKLENDLLKDESNQKAFQFKYVSRYDVREALKTKDSYSVFRYGKWKHYSVSLKPVLTFPATHNAKSGEILHIITPVQLDTEFQQDHMIMRDNIDKGIHSYIFYHNKWNRI